jgi:uncharacterized protein
MPNHLIHETSPYLLQHAHNPVEWYAWKPEAFERAKREDKPILVSIGYATCHWCHVMERESFENEGVAHLMNQFFVCIKVDREERPDVDAIYMDAIQAMGVSGGWPLNCFLTHEGKPFYGGTYFPPQAAYNRPSWSDVLKSIANTYQQRREMVQEQAEKLTKHIQQQDNAYIKPNFVTHPDKNPFTHEMAYTTFEALQERFDRSHGGFGGAPKFPSTMSLEYLLAYHFHTGNEEALAHVELSLEKMIQGGIYDQLGGGFSRYSVDNEWLVPHFEKMLYDNALLVSLLSDTYKVTKKAIYKETIEETLSFIAREMTSPEGAFYSAYDADSEGVEGKYYVWSHEEIWDILRDDAMLFCAFYDVSEEGNWEETNILWRPSTFQEFAESNNMNENELKNTLHFLKKQLFEVRNKRIKPLLDDKTILSWNALMVSAYAKAYQALGNAEYKAAAVKNIDFLLKEFKLTNDTFAHVWKDGKTQYPAFLEDYAYLAEALYDVYTITFEEKYIHAFYKVMNCPDEFFRKDDFFYTTADFQTDILMRKVEVYDNATPSGNSTMARNLQRMAIIAGTMPHKKAASTMILSLQDAITRFPTAFGRWGTAMLNEIYGIHEIAVVGKGFEKFVKPINSVYLPNKVLMAASKTHAEMPLLKDKTARGTNIYVCKDFACQFPVKNIKDFCTLVGIK